MTKSRNERRDTESKTTSAEDEARLENLAAVRLVRVAELVSRYTEKQYAPMGLRLTDLRILSTLHASEAMSIAELSRRCWIDKAWISRLTRELEDKELLTRVRHPTDTRSTVVVLTKKGRALQKYIRPQAAEREGKIIRGVSRDPLLDALRRIEANLRELLAEEGDSEG